MFGALRNLSLTKAIPALRSSTFRMPLWAAFTTQVDTDAAAAAAEAGSAASTGNADRLRGVVSKYDPKLGYGFISSGDKSYFVHWKDIHGTGFKSLRVGQDVTFYLGEAQRADKGPIAKDVITLKRPRTNKNNAEENATGAEQTEASGN